MRIAIVADTHLPKGARALPAECVAALKAADLIVHAGDLIRTEVLDELRALGEVAAVHGNVDEPALCALLPSELELQLAGGVRLAVVHDAGPRAGRMRRMRRRFPRADAVVFGHSHLPLHERDPADGFQLFNPGSPTERRRAPHRTMGLAHVTGGRIAFELIALTRPANAATI